MNVPAGWPGDSSRQGCRDGLYNETLEQGPGRRLSGRGCHLAHLCFSGKTIASEGESQVELSVGGGLLFGLHYIENQWLTLMRKMLVPVTCRRSRRTSPTVPPPACVWLVRSCDQTR